MREVPRARWRGASPFGLSPEPGSVTAAGELEGDAIGHIEVGGCTGSGSLSIQRMEIEEELRGNGYGTAALQEFVEHARRRGYDEITTTHVGSHSMVGALESAGFQNWDCDDDADRYIFRVDSE